MLDPVSRPNIQLVQGALIELHCYLWSIIRNVTQSTVQIQQLWDGIFDQIASWIRSYDDIALPVQ